MNHLNTMIIYFAQVCIAAAIGFLTNVDPWNIIAGCALYIAIYNGIQSK